MLARVAAHRRSNGRAARTPWRLAFVLTALPLLASAAPAQHKPEISYQLDEGRNINAFFRDGPVAAHLLLRSGKAPRILVAFPAGNSGVGLWFKMLETEAHWTLESSPLGVAEEAETLHGLVAIARIDAPRLELGDAVLSNVRILQQLTLGAASLGSGPIDWLRAM